MGAVSGARKAATALAALALFVLAIELLKSGAGSLEGIVRGLLRVDGPTDALGLGWLLAYLALSGSPIAATAVSLFSSGLLTPVETFFMIGGSRLGASMVVLLIGFAYQLRGSSRRTSLMAGVLSLIVTLTVYAPALALGFVLFQSGMLDTVHLTTPPEIVGLLDATVGRVAEVVVGVMGGVPTFLAGLLAVIAALSLFDRALPSIEPRAAGVGEMATRIYRPGVMFLLGMGLTTLTLSVSVSLSLLVPLSVRGYIRRENLIPYIMGANVTTFVDTLFAAIIAGAGMTIVLAEMASVTLVSVMIIGLFYTSYEAWVLGLTNAAIASTRSLGAFLLLFVLVPFLLMVL